MKTKTTAATTEILKSLTKISTPWAVRAQAREIIIKALKAAGFQAEAAYPAKVLVRLNRRIETREVLTALDQAFGSINWGISQTAGGQVKIHI